MSRSQIALSACITVLLAGFSGLGLSAEDATPKTLTLTVLDESGTPIPNAKFSYSGDPKPHDGSGYRRYTETDGDGRFVMEFKSDGPQKQLNIFIEPHGYVFFLAAWGDYSGNVETDPIPAEFSVKLEKAQTVGGIVLDDNGKPLADVSVEFTMSWGKRSRVKQPDFYVHGARTKTDANGVWKYESVPFELLGSDIGVTFEHPDYMKTTKQFKLSDLVPTSEGQFARSVPLEQGITIKGRVTNTDGKPVAGVVVAGNYDEYGVARRTKTDENGDYTLKNWAESRNAYVGVWKAGMMAALKNFPIEKGSSPVVDFTMKPAGKPVTIKLVNKAGEPIEGFSLAIERWGNRRMPDDFLLTGEHGRPRTDANGRWTWNEAPEEEVVFDMFFNENHMDVRKKSVVPRDEEHVFVSEDPINISGTVTDAETGEKIPAFNVYFGRKFANNPQIYWTIMRGAGAGGTYRVGDNDVTLDVAVKVEAEGYETAVSRDIAFNEGKITIDFALQKLSQEKAKGIYGTVLLPNGEPAADVSVAMATHGNGRPYIMNGRLYQEQKPYTILTGKDGKFKYSYIDFEAESQGRYYASPDRQKVDFLLFFLHDSGFRRLTQQEWESLDADKTVTLQPWGRVEGIVKVGTQPGKNLPIQCDFTFDNERFMSGNVPYVILQYGTTTDESGKFSLERLPPSFVTVSRTAIFNDTGHGHTSTSFHSAEKIELKPGETATVTLGGVGRPVVGKLAPSPEFVTPPDWTFSHIECTPTLEKVKNPPGVLQELREKMMPKEILNEMNPMKQMELSKAWNETEEGKEFKAVYDELTKDYKEVGERNDVKRAQRRVCAVAKDGTFRLDDIFEGDWTLQVQLDSPPPSTDSCGPGERIGMLEHHFSVAAVPDGVSDEAFDIGTLEVKQLAKQNPMPQVGETAPEFEVVKIEPIAEDGEFEETKEKLRLSDFKDKYVILDFWAMWCGPCLAKVPELKTLYEKIKDDDRFVMIGISLDNAGSEETLGKFVARREMTWLHGLSGDWNSDMARSYGINSIPALLLIGPDGKVLLSNPPLPELSQRIDELR